MTPMEVLERLTPRSANRRLLTKPSANARWFHVAAYLILTKIEASTDLEAIKPQPLKHTVSMC